MFSGIELQGEDTAKKHSELYSKSSQTGVETHLGATTGLLVGCELHM